ncbi:MAG: RnfABCDGE type electron transport complex subunit D [Nitrospira sp.]
MKYIDNFLNGITMYRLVMYGLFILCAIAITFGFVGLLPYSGISLTTSLLLSIFICYGTNQLIAKILNVQTNAESAVITSLILFLILFPIESTADIKAFALVAVLSMLSKYVFAISKKHVFNPVAISIFIAGLFGSGVTAWWIGSSVMILPVSIFGFLILRKVRRFELFSAFFVTGLVSTIIFNISSPSSFLEIIKLALLSGPIIFFGTVMLTEPLTTPPSKKLQIFYGALVGIFFGAQFDFGILYSTPGLALIIGNLFSYIVSPRARLILTLVEKRKLSKDVYEFIWKSDQKLHFKAGQYLEWTLGQEHTDNRGNRRYFTISSSPTEENIKLGIKSYENSSTFKKKLLSLVQGDKIVASQLAGDFVMTEDKNKKLVFIAGGIGVTPFRSMIKDLTDRNEKREVVLFFSNRTPNDIVYKDIFDEAEQKIGLKTIYAVNDLAGADPQPNITVGFINADMIKKEVPDFKNCTFYISGPRVMVTAFEDTLNKMGVKNIKTDFFPGFV